ncbi:hypothetical protein PV325_009811 [Microctonus aethiopoides]|nr:hypothetical protein PV325_009811 [Microctonus aethiopoides]
MVGWDPWRGLFMSSGSEGSGRFAGLGMISDIKGGGGTGTDSLSLGWGWDRRDRSSASWSKVKWDIGRVNGIWSWGPEGFVRDLIMGESLAT